MPARFWNTTHPAKTRSMARARKTRGQAPGETANPSMLELTRSEAGPAPGPWKCEGGHAYPVRCGGRSLGPRVSPSHAAGEEGDAVAPVHHLAGGDISGLVVRAVGGAGFCRPLVLGRGEVALVTLGVDEVDGRGVDGVAARALRPDLDVVVMPGGAQRREGSGEEVPAGDGG